MAEWGGHEPTFESAFQHGFAPGRTPRSWCPGAAAASSRPAVRPGPPSCRSGAPIGSVQAECYALAPCLGGRGRHGDAYALLSDLNMIVNNGGCERTELEFRELLAEGGYRLEHVIRTRVPFSVLEAVPSA